MPTDSTTFVAQTTVITAAWLNSVNAAVFADAVNVKRFGAVGDGVADDTAALTAAEAVAFAAGVALYVPQGTYLFDGQWNIRVNLSSDGATIKQKHGTVIPTNATGVINLNASGLVVRGINVDAALKSTGFSGSSLAGATLVECKASNCVNAGFGFFSCSRVNMHLCRADEIHYNAVPSTGSPADGFYLGGCTYSTLSMCSANSFRRIGFVFESDGVTKSDFVTAITCEASNANNCDDSTTEYNAGFWAENTNNVNWLYCTGYNLAGNAGQTSGRVRGMTAYAVGASVRGVANVVGCRLLGGLGLMPTGISVSGTYLAADVNIVDCFVSTATIGLSTLGGIGRLSIERLSLDSITASLASHGGVVVDGTGPTRIDYLLIDELVVTNSTFNADSAAISFFAPPSNCTYELRQTQGITHVMRGAVSTVLVQDCSVACGSTTYASFLASLVKVEATDLTLRAGVVLSSAIFSGPAVPSGSEIAFVGGTLTGSTNWTCEFGGVNIAVRASNVRCSAFTFNLSGTGSFLNHFSACDFYLVDGTVGAIRTNANAPTKQVLIVEGCYFEAGNVANTPIRKWTNDPTKSILQGNVYNTTNLTDFGVVTSNVNNVAV